MSSQDGPGVHSAPAETHGFVLNHTMLRAKDPEVSLYFLARVDDAEAIPENDGELQYHDGNAEPQGFGHICFSVPDLAVAEQWFDTHNVEFKKRSDQGKMKNVIFVKDPDGYWIEVVQPSLSRELGQ